MPRTADHGARPGHWRCAIRPGIEPRALQVSIGLECDFGLQQVVRINEPTRTAGNRRCSAVTQRSSIAGRSAGRRPSSWYVPCNSRCASGGVAEKKSNTTKDKCQSLVSRPCISKGKKKNYSWAEGYRSGRNRYNYRRPRDIERHKGMLQLRDVVASQENMQQRLILSATCL